MKRSGSTGLIITIVIAALAISAGGLFMMQGKFFGKSQDNELQDIMDVNNDEEEVSEDASPSPTKAEIKPDSGMDIDTELKSLDKDMGSAFDKDSDSDPTDGI